MEKKLRSISTIDEVIKNLPRIIEDHRIMNTFIMLDSERSKEEKLVPEYIRHIIGNPNYGNLNLNSVKYWIYNTKNQEKKQKIYQLLLAAIKHEANQNQNIKNSQNKVSEEKTMTIEEYIKKEQAAGRPNPFPDFSLEDDDFQPSNKSRWKIINIVL